MILKQYYLASLAHASYLIADLSTKTALVVDPQRDVEQYLRDASALGCVIRHVFLTHFHADFIAGHLELRALCNAQIHLGAQARADYAFRAHADGDALEFGNVRVHVLETPGHTPESVTLLVYDLERDARAPQAMLTGDTLFIGDVGRPDLLVSIGKTAREMAALLYDSLRDKLLPLPDATLVYPAHGAGSACGKNISKETSSTFGVQKQLNWALQPLEREVFIAQLTAGQAAAPAYFAFDADQNRRTRATLEQELEGALPLALAEVLRAHNAGALVLDTRTASDYAKAHVKGSTNIGLDGRFEGWIGDLLKLERALVVIAPPRLGRDAVVRLARIGFKVSGVHETDASALPEAADFVGSHPRIDASELQRRLAAPNPPLVVDVRAPSEWSAGHIPHSRNEPLLELERLAAALPRDRELVVQCLGGYRSSIACSILEQHGFTRLVDLEGGWRAWENSGGAAHR